MEVRLSPNQLRLVRQAVATRPEFIPWFNAIEPQPDARWIKVVMPAIAWQRVIDAIAAKAFNPAGQRSRDAPRAATRALMHISRMIVVYRKHPAMSGVALPDVSYEIFPTWRRGPKDYSIFPIEGAPYAVLVPRWETIGGLRITRWVPGEPPVRHPVFEEAGHLVFGYWSE